MSADYFVLSLAKVPTALEEWLSGEVFEHGALGVSEALSFDQPEGEEDVFTQTPTERSLEVYFAARPRGELIESLTAAIPGLQISVRGEENRDWLLEWKKGFKPFCLTGGHWVVPSWLEAPPDAQHKIWVDPGMAFGTGTHETTQLVAECMADLIPHHRVHSLLDVGTGTGILAILARQLEVEKISATEIEADSRRVACENFAANYCSDIVMTDQQIENLSGTFDMVVANIIDGVLVRLRDELIAKIASGGWLIVSGIIEEREGDFLSGFILPQGKKWSRRAQKGDWVLYAVQL